VFENTTFALEIIDWSGKPRYRSLLPLFYQSCSLVLVVFDLTCRVSYERALHRLAELHVALAPQSLVGLIGTRADEPDRHAVSADEVGAYCDQRRIFYFPTSTTHPGIGRTLAPADMLLVFLQLYHSHIGRFPSPVQCAAIPKPQAPALQTCRVADLYFGQRRDYQHSLPTRMVNTNPFLCGFLWKKGHWRHSWRERFFVLRDSFLYYYVSDKDEHPKGVIALLGSRIESCTERPFSLLIVTNSAASEGLSHETYAIAASSESEKQNWLRALQDAVDYAQELRNRDPAVSKWLASLKPLLPDVRYTEVEMKVSIASSTLTFMTLGLSAAESITVEWSFDPSSLRVLRVHGNDRQFQLSDDLGKRLLLIDTSAELALFGFLKKSLPAGTTFGAMTHQEYALNMMLSYFLSCRRLSFPLLKPFLDELLVKFGPARPAVAPLDNNPRPRGSSLSNRDATSLPLEGVADLSQLCLRDLVLWPQDLDALTQALAFYPYCCSLDLEGCSFMTLPSSNAFAILSEELCANPRIVKLNLCKCSIPSPVGTCLAFLMRKNAHLQELRLCHVALAGAEVDQLLHALRSNKKLLELDLSFCGIDDGALLALENLLGMNTTLQRLVLNGNRLSKDSGKHLVASLANNTTLLHFELSGMPLDAASLGRIASHLEATRQRRLPARRSPQLVKP
jgi:hypothetical protein